MRGCPESYCLADLSVPRSLPWGSDRLLLVGKNQLERLRQMGQIPHSLGSSEKAQALKFPAKAGTVQKPSTDSSTMRLGRHPAPTWCLGGHVSVGSLGRRIALHFVLVDRKTPTDFELRDCDTGPERRGLLRGPSMSPRPPLPAPPARGRSGVPRSDSSPMPLASSHSLSLAVPLTRLG